MFKLLFLAAIMAVAAAKRGLVAPVAYSSPVAAYAAPVAGAYSAYSAPFGYSAYSAPFGYSAYSGYASPYASYYYR